MKLSILRVNLFLFTLFGSLEPVRLRQTRRKSILIGIFIIVYCWRLRSSQTSESLLYRHVSHKNTL